MLLSKATYNNSYIHSSADGGGCHGRSRPAHQEQFGGSVFCQRTLQHADQGKRTSNRPITRHWFYPWVTATHIWKKETKRTLHTTMLLKQCTHSLGKIRKLLGLHWVFSRDINFVLTLILQFKASDAVTDDMPILSRIPNFLIVLHTQSWTQPRLMQLTGYSRCCSNNTIKRQRC